MFVRIVARRARAWIETGRTIALGSSVIVARRARAWIETATVTITAEIFDVARRARAWIETLPTSGTDTMPSSPAVRGRGLKPLRADFGINVRAVARRARAWIDVNLHINPAGVLQIKSA